MPQLPKFDPAHRAAKVGPVRLPAAGRQGDPPAWPLEDAGEAELAVWEQVWACPQAVAWELLGAGTARLVARYCRLLVRAEQPDVSASMLAQVTALEDRLGLTPKAMRLMLWTIASDPPVNDPPPDRASVRARMRAVS